MPTPHGADRLEAGPGGTLVLLSPFPKGWTPRREASLTNAEHPGTAVVWEGEHWEVVAAEPAGGGVRYRLAPWDERHAIRVRDLYDAETEARRLETRSVDEASRRFRALAVAAAPVTGLLPGAVLERWEMEHGVPAQRLTIISTILPFFVGGTVLVLFLAAAFGGAALPPLLLPLIWFFPESIFRFGTAMSRSESVGSVAGVALWYLWRGVGKG